MGDLDGIDAGIVERGDDPLHVLRVDPVADGVHPVTQRDVLDVEVGHATAPAVRSSCSAIRSAVRMAADVMMSRLPA